MNNERMDEEERARVKQQRIEPDLRMRTVLEQVT